MNEALLAALRETPTVSRHLHVPLQSGDDGVLRAMARRYDSATWLRRVGLAGDFNLTTDVIVGFPAEDERAFRNTLRVVEASGRDEGARLPVLAAAGHRHRRRGHGPEAREEGAQRPAARRIARGVPAPLAREVARTSCSSTAPAAATATTTRRGSSTRPSASSSGCARSAVTDEGILAA